MLGSNNFSSLCLALGITRCLSEPANQWIKDFNFPRLPDKITAETLNSSEKTYSYRRMY